MNSFFEADWWLPIIFGFRMIWNAFSLLFPSLSSAICSAHKRYDLHPILWNLFFAFQKIVAADSLNCTSMWMVMNSTTLIKRSWMAYLMVSCNTSKGIGPDRWLSCKYLCEIGRWVSCFLLWRTGWSRKMVHQIIITSLLIFGVLTSVESWSIHQCFKDLFTEDLEMSQVRHASEREVSHSSVHVVLTWVSLSESVVTGEWEFDWVC